MFSWFNVFRTFFALILDSEHLIYWLHLNARFMHNVINVTFYVFIFGSAR